MQADYPVDCPHCEAENDLGPDWYESLGRDTSFQWECESCGRWFDIEVEFDPVFYPAAPEAGPKVPWDHPAHPMNVWKRERAALARIDAVTMEGGDA